MVPLKRFLEKKRVDPFTCVAISIACLKRLQTLYDTGLVQQRFGMDDIYMRRNENVSTVSYRYLKVKVHPKLLISQSKFSGPRKFTLRYQLFEISEFGDKRS